MRVLAPRAVGVVVAALVLAASCGGGGDGEAAATTELRVATTTATSAPTSSTSTAAFTSTTATPTTATPSTSTPASAPTTTTTAAPAGFSHDLSECAVEPRAEFRAPRMEFDGEVARVFVRDGRVHITTEAISAAIDLPSEWTLGLLETSFDANGDGTDELIFTPSGNLLLTAVVVAIDGCSLVPIPVDDGTTTELEIRHGVLGDWCLGCEATIYCLPTVDGRIELVEVWSTPLASLLDDDFTMDELEAWFDSERTRQYVVRHYSWNEGTLVLDWEHWDWIPEGLSRWPSTNQIEPCSSVPTPDATLVLDETGIADVVAFGASPNDAMEALAMIIGPPTHDTGWSDGITITFCDHSRVRHISWGDLLLVFADAPFGTFAAGLVHISATAIEQFEDGFAALAPRTWPNVVLGDSAGGFITPFDAELQSDPMWGAVFSGADCRE